MFDATCPLVTKVHNEAIRYARAGYQIFLVGHADHQEIIGTRGEAPATASSVTLSPDEIVQVEAKKATAAIVMHYTGHLRRWNCEWVLIVLAIALLPVVTAIARRSVWRYAASITATFAGPIGTPVRAPAATPISRNISTAPPTKPMRP